MLTADYTVDADKDLRRVNLSAQSASSAVKKSDVSQGGLKPRPTSGLNFFAPFRAFLWPLLLFSAE
jgi:hypothetical protein